MSAPGTTIENGRTLGVGGSRTANPEGVGAGCPVDETGWKKPRMEPVGKIADDTPWKKPREAPGGKTADGTAWKNRGKNRLEKPRMEPRGKNHGRHRGLCRGLNHGRNVAADDCPDGLTRISHKDSSREAESLVSTKVTTKRRNRGPTFRRSSATAKAARRSNAEGRPLVIAWRSAS
ncbi:hypothetical protein APED_18145 [Acanthopleuribacter pedis]